MKREQLIKLARKHYIHFLKFTSPNNPKFDEAPINLLELLDNSHKRWHKLKAK